MKNIPRRKCRKIYLEAIFPHSRKPFFKFLHKKYRKKEKKFLHKISDCILREYHWLKKCPIVFQTIIIQNYDV